MSSDTFDVRSLFAFQSKTTTDALTRNKAITFITAAYHLLKYGFIEKEQRVGSVAAHHQADVAYVVKHYSAAVAHAQAKPLTNAPQSENDQLQEVVWRCVANLVDHPIAPEAPPSQLAPLLTEALQGNEDVDLSDDQMAQNINFLSFLEKKGILQSPLNRIREDLT